MRHDTAARGSELTFRGGSSEVQQLSDLILVAKIS